MKPFVSYFVGAFAMVALSAAGADTTLWYNGDLRSGGGGTVNEETSNIGVANIYDDFNVTSPGGWIVDRVWSDNSMSYTGVSQASWSIRSGMSSGNPGTVVSSGISFATQAPTGRSNPSAGTPEYFIEVSGLNVYLAPGTYWLSVSPLVGNDPISSGYLRSYLSVTLGVNAVGAPTGNNGNSFIYWPYAGYNYSSTPFNEDYSLGLAGTVVPEPSTCAFAVSFGMLVLLREAQNRSRRFVKRA